MATLDTTRIVNHHVVLAAGTYELDAMHTFVNFTAQHLVVGYVHLKMADLEWHLRFSCEFLGFELVCNPVPLLSSQRVAIIIASREKKRNEWKRGRNIYGHEFR
jgi:hypothetical protein